MVRTLVQLILTLDCFPEEVNKFVLVLFYGKIYLIPVYLINYLTQVSFIKSMYDQKLINEQASKLVSNMLNQINDIMNKSDVKEFFEKSSLMKTAITYETTKVIVQCLDKFPYLLCSEMEG